MPLIFAFLAALLSIACMVVSLWYGVLWLAGSVATAQGAGIFMLGQIGAVFCAVFALVLWQYHTGSEKGTRLLRWLIVALFVEVGLGLGGYVVYTVHLHHTLQTRGLPAEAVVYRHERERDFSSDDSLAETCHACYRFTASDGKVYEGRTTFSLGEMKVGHEISLRMQPSALMYKVGSRLPVLYLPESPACHMVNTREQIWGSLMVQISLCLLSFGAAGYMVYQVRQWDRKQSRRLKL